MCLVTRGAGIPTVINVDGLDSDRRKWPAPAKRYLRFAERDAPRWADERSPTRTPSPTSSSAATARASASCPTASRTRAAADTQTLERLGLEPRRYVLFVGRLEPENNPHLLVEAFARISSGAGARA